MRKTMALLLCLGLLAAGLPSAGRADVFPFTATTLVKCNLRNGPSTESATLVTIEAGESVILMDQENEWYLAKYGAEHGFIRQDMLNLSDTEIAPTLAPTATPGPNATVAPTASSSSSSSSSASSSSASVSIGRTLQYGSRGDDVLQMQQRLIDLGYTPLTATGTYATNTLAAVKKYQRAMGLTADGIAGPRTLGALFGTQPTTPTAGGSPGGLADGGTSTSVINTSYPLLKSGSQGDQVRALQLGLQALGYFNTTATGTYGSITTAAVKDFQRANGLLADGLAGVLTQRLLFEGSPVAAGSGAVVSPTPGPSSSGSSSSSGSDGSGSYLMLKKGSTGEAVSRLQSALAGLGYYSGAISGSYDTATAAAVTWFQQNNDTGVDGVAGPATQRILYERTPRRADEGPAPRPTLAPGAGQIAGPDTSRVELAHWFNDVKKSYRSGQTYTVYDPATGLGWNLKFYAMGNHADSEPLTQQDTDIMYAAFGNRTTWDPKPVYAHMPDGRWIIATMHNTPHLTGSIRDNGFDGHLCVHFYRDMDEVSKTDPNYGVQNQNVLRAAWNRIH